MNKWQIKSVKIILLVLMIWQTGLLQLVYKSDGGQSDSRGSEYFRNYPQLMHSKMMKVAEDKIARAKAKGDDYSPADYFTDLADLDSLAKLYKVMVPNLAVSQLQGLLNSNTAGLQPVFSDKKKKSYHFTITDLERARDSYQAKINPLTKAREKFSWVEVGEKSFSFYLSCLPLAFILYLLWWYEDDKHKRFRLTVANFLKFIGAVVGYPLVIGLVFMRWIGREGASYYAETQVRRTKEKFFSVLSDEEVLAIERFAKSKAERQNFRVWLENRLIRHSLAWGLMATIVVTMLPMRLMAEQSACSMERQVAQICASSSAQHVLVIDNHQPDGGANHFSVDLSVEKIFILQFFISVWLVRLKEFFFKGFDLCTEIQHVPLYSS